MSRYFPTGFVIGFVLACVLSVAFLLVAKPDAATAFGVGVVLGLVCTFVCGRVA